MLKGGSGNQFFSNELKSEILNGGSGKMLK